MIKYLPVMLLFVSVAHADVIANTDESQTANLMYNGCSAQRAEMTIDQLMRVANPEKDKRKAELLRYGYKFAIDYPTVGCNQFFTTMIDALVTGKPR